MGWSPFERCLDVRLVSNRVTGGVRRRILGTVDPPLVNGGLGRWQAGGVTSPQACDQSSSANGVPRHGGTERMDQRSSVTVAAGKPHSSSFQPRVAVAQIDPS